MPGNARLFGSRLSPFVEKVARALQRKRIPFELEEPAGPWSFRSWNPQARKMPVLEIDGRRIYDSTFICRHLDTIVPNPVLLSADPKVAAAQRNLEDWSDEGLIHLADLVTILGDREFFYSGEVSVADLALYGQFHMLRSGCTPEAEALIEERPSLMEFIRRVEDATDAAAMR